ncbi:MAG: MFS transporter [Chloroflexi bacterium]|nr:MFS transporter [Chloroflexota bacterium]
MSLTSHRRAQNGAGAAVSPTRQAIPPVVKRNTIYFAGAQALQGSGFQLVVTLGPLMVLRLIGSATLAGIGVSVIGLSRMLVAYPMGKMTDSFGRRPGMLLGLLFGLVGAILLGGSMLALSFPLFLSGLVIFGLGVGATQQLRVAATDMYPPARRAEGLGYLFTGTMVGTLLAPILVSAANAWSEPAGLDPLALSWALTPLILIPAIVLILFVRPDPKEIGNNLGRYWPGYIPPPGSTASVAPVGGFLTFVRHYPKLVAYICSAAAQGSMSMMMVMTALVLREHNHSLPAISVSITVHVLGMFAFSLPLGQIADRVGRKPILLAGVLLIAIGAVVMPLTPSYWVITGGIFVVGLGWSAINVASTALIADTTTPQERGRAIGANDTFAAAFNIVTPLLGGFMAGFTGLVPVGILGAAFMAVPFVLLTRLREGSPGRYEEVKQPAKAGT